MAGNTVFDGECKVKDVFADVNIQKFFTRQREKNIFTNVKLSCIMNIAFRRIRVCLDCAVKHTEAPESSAGDEC